MTAEFTREQERLLSEITQELRRETALAYIANGYSNKKQAYISACEKMGKKPSKTPESSASEILNYPNVTNFINSVKAAAAAEVQIDAAYVLRRLVEIDQMDFLDILNDDHSIKSPSEWPKVWRTYLSAIDMAEIWEGAGEDREMTGMLKKIKWPDKVKNLELLGKHVDVMAFKEKIEVDATVVQSVMPVPTADSVEGWEESAKKNQDSVLSRD